MTLSQEQKREVFGDVGIEGMIAGPSEITVVADKTVRYV